MRDAGMLSVHYLSNIATPGRMPKEGLVKICDAYYTELTIYTSRAYAALSANQQIDMLVRIYNTELPINAEYVVLEDGNQYRISLKQKQGDHIDLTLVRLEDYYDCSEPA